MVAFCTRMTALLFALTLASLPPHVPLEIPLGSAYAIDGSNIQSFSIVPAGIIDVRVWPKFAILAKRPGHATLWLYDKKRQATIYDITVK